MSDATKRPLHIRQALKQTLLSLWRIVPVLLSVIGLIGLFEALVTPQMLKTLFGGTALYEMAVGVATGGISVGQPFLSYAIGEALLKDGVSLYGVTAFVLSFVTLGVVQLPLEISLFGGRFTLVRNLLSLIFAFLVAWASVWITGVLH